MQRLWKGNTLSSKKYIEHGYLIYNKTRVKVRIAEFKEDSYVDINFGEPCVLDIDTALELMNIIKDELEDQEWKE